MADQLTDVKDSIQSISERVSSLFSTKQGASNQDKLVQEKLLSQLSEITAKFNDLEKTVNIGIPLNQATDGVEKLENLQRSIEGLDSKLNLFISNSKELKIEIESLNKTILTKVNKAQVEAVSEKITNLEKLYSDLSVSKTNESLMSLIGIIENLRKRIKTLEDSVEKDVFEPNKEGAFSTPAVNHEEFNRRTVNELKKPAPSYETDYTETEDNEKVGFFGGIIRGITSLFKK